MDRPGSPTLLRYGLRLDRSARSGAGANAARGSSMTPVKGGYAVDVPVINVSEKARRERASVWTTFRAFAVTIRHLFTSLFKGDTPTIYDPEQSRPDSERLRGTHILTVRDDGSLKCVACYMCATICPAECIYIEAGEHPNPEIEKFPLRFDIDMMRCIYCGFCVDACPEEAIIMS